jgi:hypothetical protein
MTYHKSWDKTIYQLAFRISSMNSMRRKAYNHVFSMAYPLVNCHITNWKSQFFMGKSTIYKSQFSIVFCMFTRGYQRQDSTLSGPDNKSVTGSQDQQPLPSGNLT